MACGSTTGTAGFAASAAKRSLRSARISIPLWWPGFSRRIQSPRGTKYRAPRNNKAALRGRERQVERPTSYRTAQIDGLNIFYREVGPKDAPTLLLLHGLPSSSRMFEPLFARLSDRFHLVAPDYPGFGHSDWPDPKKIRVYLRSLRRDHKSLHRSARALALHALHAGLRRPRGFSHGLGSSGADGG